ncbi:MAG: hypothetical protein ACRBBN_13140 [Methyloligellaceae bacterium]
MSDRKSGHGERSLLVVEPPSPHRDSFRSAYKYGSYRMYAPFLTQLSTQYDPVDILNAQRQDRRERAKEVYVQEIKTGDTEPEDYCRRDIKI